MDAGSIPAASTKTQGPPTSGPLPLDRDDASAIRQHHFNTCDDRMAATGTSFTMKRRSLLLGATGFSGLTLFGRRIRAGTRSAHPLPALLNATRRRCMGPVPWMWFIAGQTGSSTSPDAAARRCPRWRLRTRQRQCTAAAGFHTSAFRTAYRRESSRRSDRERAVHVRRTGNLTAWPRCRPLPITRPNNAAASSARSLVRHRRRDGCRIDGIEYRPSVRPRTCSSRTQNRARDSSAAMPPFPYHEAKQRRSK